MVISEIIQNHVPLCDKDPPLPVPQLRNLTEVCMHACYMLHSLNMSPLTLPTLQRVARTTSLENRLVRRPYTSTRVEHLDLPFRLQLVDMLKGFQCRSHFHPHELHKSVSIQ